MKTLLTAAVAATLAFSGPLALAKTVRSADLPRATVGELPDVETAPKRIGKTERAEGFHLARAPKQSHVQVLPTTELAKKFSRGAYPGWGAQEGACYAQREVPIRPSKGALSLTSRLSYYDSDLKHLGNGVVPGHTERFVVQKGGQAQLRVRRAWLDLRTLGSRRIVDRQVPFREIATGPLGVVLYAARDGDKVHFIVRRPPAHPRFGAPGITIELEEAFIGHSDCGHARVTLDAADVGGQAAKLKLELNFERTKTGKLVPIRELAPPHQNLSGRLVESIGLGKTPPPLRERGVRTLIVHLSVSRTSSDPSPVASAAFGWANRARFVTF